MLTPNELVLTFGDCYFCATFGENRSRNASVRVRTDRQTDRHMHAETETETNRQTEFISCLLINMFLYQESTNLERMQRQLRGSSSRQRKLRNFTLKSVHTPASCSGYQQIGDKHITGPGVPEVDDCAYENFAL